MNDPRNLSPTKAPRPASRRGLTFQIAALMLVVSALAATGLAKWLRNPPENNEVDKPAVKFPGRVL
jgi:hypothetical protein